MIIAPLSEKLTFLTNETTKYFIFLQRGTKWKEKETIFFYFFALTGFGLPPPPPPPFFVFLLASR
jgi:hypothetical protein